LSLMFHELATNAAKYGALSAAGGWELITWSVTPGEIGQILDIQWREQGGPRVAPPSRQGFGTRLIERSLLGGHHGSAALDFKPEGLCCDISLPLDPPQATTA
jgi:two-component sensor histidine kinase